MESISQIFTKIYQRNSWSNGSGPGSSSEFTAEYREFLEKFLINNQISTVFDIGCGDWQFSKLINWNNVNYTGIDIVESLIQTNNTLYSSHNIKFLLLNAIEKELPQADLFIIKDCLQHLSFASIKKILKNILKYRYILFVNDHHTEYKNVDCEDGSIGGRKLNLLLPPFNLPTVVLFKFDTRRGKHPLKVVEMLKYQ